MPFIMPHFEVLLRSRSTFIWLCFNAIA